MLFHILVLKQIVKILDDNFKFESFTLYAGTPIKPIKKKRQMSEEHKAKLQAGRLKGLETRRKKAQEKKELKELIHLLN